MCCGGIASPAVRWITNPAAASIAPSDTLAFVAKSGVIWARCTRWHCLPVHSQRLRACPLFTRGLLIPLFHMQDPGAFLMVRKQLLGIKRRAEAA